MFPGMDQVFQAVQLFVGRNAMRDGRFCEAATEFLAALRYSDQWPEDSLEKALEIQQRLTAGGSIEETIRNMDTSTADAIAEDILDLAEAIAAPNVLKCGVDYQEDDEDLHFPVVRFHGGHLRAGKRLRHQGRHVRLSKC